MECNNGNTTKQWPGMMMQYAWMLDELISTARPLVSLGRWHAHLYIYFMIIFQRFTLNFLFKLATLTVSVFKFLLRYNIY